MAIKHPIRFSLKPLPADQDEAVLWLLKLARAGETKTLAELSTTEFKRGWYSLGFLYPGLHPDSALEHGTELSHDSEDILEISRIEPRLVSPYYVQSGWPLLLEPVAKEAWRRYETDELKDDEFYCSEAVTAGMCWRNPDLMNSVREERKRVLA